MHAEWTGRKFVSGGLGRKAAFSLGPDDFPSLSLVWGKVGMIGSVWMDHNQVKPQALKTCQLVFCVMSQSFLHLTVTSHFIGLIFVVYRSPFFVFEIDGRCIFLILVF